MPDKDGRDAVIVVAKGTFVEGADMQVLAEEQMPLVHADEYRGDSQATSMIAASDMVFFKPATDVVVIGSAYAPGGKPVREMVVEFTLGAINKRARVFGDRIWEKTLLGLAPSPPQPFTSLPLVYERAFGGVHPKPGQPETFVAEPRNLVGRGCWEDAPQARGQPLPNIEDPDHPLRSWKDRPAPRGFGWVSPNWQPRLQLAGTYDEKWRQTRMPLLPADFDDAFFNAAPVDQQAAPYLTGGEQATLNGFRPDGSWNFSLPHDVLSVRMLYPRDVRREVMAVLDTVVIEPDLRRCQLVWRAKIVAPDPITPLLYVELNSRLCPQVESKLAVTEEVVQS